MILEHPICVKKILDKIITFILTFIGISVILGISYLLLLPYFREYEFINSCLSEKHLIDFCQAEWNTLKNME